MNIETWKHRNSMRRFGQRLRHPWPLYRKGGGINAVVLRADGSRDDLGRVSDTYVRRSGWKVGSRGE